MGLVKSSTLAPLADEAALPDGTPLIGWHNIVTISNITATKSNVNYPVTNLANPATNQEWHQSAADSPPDSPDVPIDIVVTNAGALVDYVAIAGHNFGTEGISVGVFASSPGDLNIATAVPTSDDPLVFWFTPSTYTSITIRLTNTGASAAKAAVVYVGKLLVCERGFDVDGDFIIPRFSRRVNVVQGRSSQGDYLGRIVLSQFLEDITINFEHFTPAWYRTHFDPFLLAAQQDGPFFFVWSPDEYPLETAYVWLTEDPNQFTNPVTRRQKVSLKMGGVTA